jgi:hypothetical protein
MSKSFNVDIRVSSSDTARVSTLVNAKEKFAVKFTPIISVKIARLISIAGTIVRVARTEQIQVCRPQRGTRVRDNGLRRPEKVHRDR